MSKNRQASAIFLTAQPGLFWIFITHLQNWERTGHSHQHVRLFCCGQQWASDDTEHGINEETKRRHTKEDVIQVALLISFELQALHSVRTQCK